MEFGVQINSRSYGGLRNHVQKAEKYGYAAVYMPDHFIYEQAGGGFDADMPVFEALSMLAALAEATTTIKIGTHVACILFRHPALTAKMFTTLDHVSEGRLIAGFGAGWTKQEFDMMGMEFPDVTTRLRMMEEHIDVVRALWTEPVVNYSGEFYTITDAVCTPKPVQQPHPPILLGGNGNGVLRRAGRFADRMNIAVQLGEVATMSMEQIQKFTGESFKRKVGVVREEEAKAGRAAGSVRISATIFQFMVTDSPDTTQAVRGNMGEMYGLPAEDIAHLPMVLIGTPEEMVEEIRYRAREWGLEEVILAANRSAEMRDMGEQVLPAFA